MALDVRRSYQADQKAKTGEVLGRLEKALKRLPVERNPDQQIVVEQASNHLRSGRQLEAEGGWGYAQMHGYIGMGMLQRLNR